MAGNDQLTAKAVGDKLCHSHQTSPLHAFIHQCATYTQPTLQPLTHAVPQHAAHHGSCLLHHTRSAMSSCLLVSARVFIDSGASSTMQEHERLQRHKWRRDRYPSLVTCAETSIKQRQAGHTQCALPAVTGRHRCCKAPRLQQPGPPQIATHCQLHPRHTQHSTQALVPTTGGAPMPQPAPTT